jgi:hypothetical protein
MRGISTAIGAFFLGVTACTALPSEEGTRAQARKAAARADAGAADARAMDAGPPSYVTIPLSSCTPALYTAAVTIDRTQSFQLAVDTGSTTLAVAAATCSDCSGVEPLYTPGASAVNEHEMASSAYGTGSWSGQIYQDVIAVGAAPDARTDPVMAVPMPIVAIDSQSDFFMGLTCDSSNGGFQGILGLGPNGAAVQGTTGYFDVLVSHGMVPDVFALELCDQSGTLWLGGYDPAATTGPLVYTPELSSLDSYYYAIDLEAVRVAGQRVPVATKTYPTSVVDAGSSVFLLARTAFDQVTSALAADAGFTEAFGGVDEAWFENGGCGAPSSSKADLDAKLPPMTLELGTDPAVLLQVAPTESYLVPYDGEWCSAMDVFDPNFEVPIAADVGTPVMRSRVVVFDRAHKRVGFAPHVPCP